jgi:hypothetical protein
MAGTTPTAGTTRIPSAVNFIINASLSPRRVASVGADDLQMREVAANELNRQSRTGDKGWSFSLAEKGGLVEDCKHLTVKKTRYEMLHSASDCTVTEL